MIAWFDGPLPRVLAHRGLALDAPENSLAAFEAALAAGATHVETDVRVTADAVAVLIHDPELPDGTAVAALSLERLRALHPSVCTVAEALAALPDARFNLDVKTAAAAPPLAAAVRAAGAIPRVLVTSFHGRSRRTALRLLPGAVTSASRLGVAVALAGVLIRSDPLVASALRDVQAVQIPERLLGVDASTPWFIAALHRAGVEVHFWVVNDSARMRELVARGADGIVTDRADLARDALR